MRLLTVPNWSFGRDKVLLRGCRELLGNSACRVHFCDGDVDHNRTVTAFSGDPLDVFELLGELAKLILPGIDLNRHMGVHPRIGGLDVCPFVVLEGDLPEAIQFVDGFAEVFAAEWQIPVYLYERSEHGRHEADLPSLRKGGFGALAGRVLNPDFGPPAAHPHLGVTVMGVRDPLVAMNVELRTEDLRVAKEIAKAIRLQRAEGNPVFLGVRALGFPLTSRGLTQVSLNLTLPELTQIDPIIEWITAFAQKKNVAVDGTELIGVIRPPDVEHADRLVIKKEQIVE